MIHQPLGGARGQATDIIDTRRADTKDQKKTKHYTCRKDPATTWKK